MKNNSILLLLALLLAPSLQAKEVTFAYDSFYDRLKVVDKGQYEFARIGFYLVDTNTMKPCRLRSGEIVTENASFPLTYTEDAQLLLPFDKQLDKDKAKVIMVPHASEANCQLKMQIEAELFEQQSLSKADLYTIHQEFEQLLADLSGFFVKYLFSFLLPEQQGLILNFTTPDQVMTNIGECQTNSCQVIVEESWQQNSTTLVDQAKAVHSIQPWLDL